MKGKIMSKLKKNFSPVLKADEVEEMDFFRAMKKVLSGKKISKEEWSDKSIYGTLHNGILMLHKADNKLHNWIISEGDLIGEDWKVVS
jgi:hypothetical protein